MEQNIFDIRVIITGNDCEPVFDSCLDIFYFYADLMALIPETDAHHSYLWKRAFLLNFTVSIMMLQGKMDDIKYSSLVKLIRLQEWKTMLHLRVLCLKS